MPIQLETPQNLADLLSDPQRVRDAFDLLNALSDLEVHLVPAGTATIGRGVAAIKGDPPSLILPLPIKLSSAIADSTATAASVSAQLNALLAGLRSTGMLPA